MTVAPRRAGLLVPLFSFPASASWGIGDISDVVPMCAWLRGAGQRVLQLLPLNEMATGQQSPYSAMSAMAIDPIFIAVPGLVDFEAIGGESSLEVEDQQRLNHVRRCGHVDYVTVRELKERVLGRAFERFRREWNAATPRATEMHLFLQSEAWWLDDYALFRALHDREGHRPWTTWTPALRDREPEAIEATRLSLADTVLFHQYLQWIAASQWSRARAGARANGVALFGDLPFMVDGDSADVWVHQGDFRLDASVGVPPDAFSLTGQDWGMPAYRWDAIQANGFKWLRGRARRSAVLYDGYRIDHLVGFYRTYSRNKKGGEPTFDPAEEPAQTALGEQILNIFREPGAEIIAEDLGLVPDFVRDSLSRLHAPGFRVLRWEREWDVPGQPFRDPALYPALSVAASGTHDTEPMITWWETASDGDRRAVGHIPSIERLMGNADLTRAPYSPMLRDALLETLSASGSNLVLIPIQDVFGWRDRINEPATVSAKNWTFRLPWPVDRMSVAPAARERQEALRAWAHRHGRMDGPVEAIDPSPPPHAERHPPR
jgi:4-alpha-glucanotransferase